MPWVGNLFFKSERTFFSCLLAGDEERGEELDQQSLGCRRGRFKQSQQVERSCMCLSVWSKGSACGRALEKLHPSDGVPRALWMQLELQRRYFASPCVKGVVATGLSELGTGAGFAEDSAQRGRNRGRQV